MYQRLFDRVDKLQNKLGLNHYLGCDFVQCVPCIGSPWIRYIEQPDPLVIVTLHSTPQTAFPFQEVRHLFAPLLGKSLHLHQLNLHCNL